MKQNFVLSILAGCLILGSLGCHSVATDTPGVFVDNVEGTYDLAAITENNVCTSSFDTIVKVVQTQDHFSILAETSGFDDLAGVFDGGSGHTYTLEGGNKECTGSVVDGLLTNICTASVQSCTADSTGVETCSTVGNSCEVTYQKR